MAWYEFVCDVCGQKCESEAREWPSDRHLDRRVGGYPSSEVAWCYEPVRRVWSAPAIGRVEGAGGSPGRKSV